MARGTWVDIPGSGRIKVTSRQTVARAIEDRDRQLLMRDEPTPLEGTRMDLFNSQIPAFFAENGMLDGFFPGNAGLAERVWVSSRCLQLNSQQIAAMPIEFHGPDGAQPAWVSNPDPNVFPNGISDALFAVIWQLYSWGFSCQWVTGRYADGFPRTWTVLPSSTLNIRWKDGAREYKAGDEVLDPSRIIQIDRNPTTAAHGTSAIAAYAQTAWGLMGAGNQSNSVTSGGIPQAVLKSARKIDKAQAERIQLQWATATDSRNGLVPVLPPELDFEVLSINPTDLALLETQEWNARVLATAYGVPPTILNMSLQGGLTYQNPLALMQMWWLTELRTTAKRFADAFSAQALPAGQWVSVDASDITVEGTAESAADDPQLAERPPLAAKASPAQLPPALTAIGG